MYENRNPSVIPVIGSASKIGKIFNIFMIPCGQRFLSEANAIVNAAIKNITPILLHMGL